MAENDKIAVYADAVRDILRSLEEVRRKPGGKRFIDGNRRNQITFQLRRIGRSWGLPDDVVETAR